MVTLDPSPQVLCMSVTPFTDDDQVDEEGLRAHLRRIVASGCGVYMGSGGSGEGHALTLAELKRVYEIGVEECRGKVPTYANPREARSAKQMLQVADIAASAGIEMVQLYPVDGGHGMRPNFAEQEQYYRDLLDHIDYPVAISVHPMGVGYVTPSALIQKLCGDYDQIKAINVMAGQPMSNFVEFRESVKPGIKLYTSMSNVLEGMAQGSSGCLATEPNLVPKLSKTVVDNFARGAIQGAGEAMSVLIKLNKLLNRWSPGAARPIKLGMKVLGLGNGNLRRPYLLPGEEDQKQLAADLEALGLMKLEAAL
jgi:4-hydroxy-tetrahydrodipicolinate synthase